MLALRSALVVFNDEESDNWDTFKDALMSSLPRKEWFGGIALGLIERECKGNYSITRNNVKLVHWQLLGGLLHLVQRGGDWAGLKHAQVHPCCTKCISPLINGQCTNHCIAV